MKKLYYILILSVVIVYSCVKDDSTDTYPSQDSDFSFITISTDIDSISVDFGEALHIEPNVTQTIESKTLEYTWVAWPLYDGVKGDSLVVSSEKDLEYQFESIGEFEVRLEVKNEDYSEFFKWFVITRLFDKGFIISGMNDAGESIISFARSLSENDIADGMELEFTIDLFHTVNPNYSFDNLVKVVRSKVPDNTGNGESIYYVYVITDTTIYILDQNSFIVLSAYEIGSVAPGAKILEVTANEESTNDLILLTDNPEKAVINFTKDQLFFYQSDLYNQYPAATFEDMTSTSYRDYESYGSTRTYNEYPFIDYTNDNVYAYGYYSNTHVPESNALTSQMYYHNGTAGENILEGYDIISIGKSHGVNGINSDASVHYLAAKSKTNPLDVRVVSFYSSVYYGVYTWTVLTDYTSTVEPTMPEGQDMVGDGRNDGGAIYYFNGNNVYEWNPYVTPELPTIPVITLDGSKEVTCMNISYDFKELYVGFVDNAASGLKGSMAIYNTADLRAGITSTPTQVFENITHNPVNIYYKESGDFMYDHY